MTLDKTAKDITPMATASTRIGWMESNDLHVGQYHCPQCDTIFHFLDDDTGEIPPKFCPCCGRKNLRAA